MNKENIFKKFKRGVAGLLIGGMIAGGTHGAIKNHQQSEQIEDLRATISQLQQDKQDKNTQPQDYVTAGQMNELIAKIADLNKNLSQYSINNNTTNNGNITVDHSNEIAELKAQIAKIQTQLKDEISALKIQFEALQNNVISPDEINSLNEIVKKLQTEMATLTEKIEQSKDEDLSSELSQLQNEINLLSLRAVLQETATRYDYLKIEMSSDTDNSKGIIGFSKDSSFMYSNVPSEGYTYYNYYENGEMYDVDNEEYSITTDARSYTIKNMPAGVIPYRESILSCTFDEQEGVFTITTEYEGAVDTIIEYYVSYSGVVEKVVVQDKIYKEKYGCDFVEMSEKDYKTLFTKVKAGCDELIAEHQANQEQGLGR